MDLVNIKSDGKGQMHSGMGTKVTDSKTGKTIGGVRSIDIHIGLEEVVSATIEIMPGDVDIKDVKANFKIVDVTSLDSIGGYREFRKIGIKMNWFKELLWNLFFKKEINNGKS